MCYFLNVWSISLSLFFKKDVLSKNIYSSVNHEDEQKKIWCIDENIVLELNMILKQFILSLDLKKIQK